MVYFKSCRKCHGDMFLDKDRYGAYLHCVQCGFFHDLVENLPIASQVDGLVPRQKQVVA